MKDFIQPLNPIVTGMEMDGLTLFQESVRGIPDLIKLTYGEPGFNVAEPIKDAIIESVQDNNSHYVESRGIVELRQAAVNYFNQRYDLAYEDADNVIVTAGVSEAINVVFDTILNDGEGVIVPEPAYPPYFAALALARGRKISINTRPNKFKLTAAMIDEAVDNARVPVKAVLFNYPSNPSGVTYSRAELEELAEAFVRNRLWVISDELYSQLTYDQEHVSMASIIPNQVIMITGLSKSHAMTGYRIGFVIGQKKLIEQASKVHDTLTFSLPKVLQDGALTALTSAANVAEEMRDIYKRRRDWLIPKLTEMGFKITNPEGAFYIFAQIPADFGNDGNGFAMQLAQEAHVALVPGSAFSKFTADYVRISYAASDEDLQEAVARMEQYFAAKRD
ncbi:MAG: aminotransferase class I/II-fold pyridoxal phosphate-dependent enzyme [Lactobacillaceae bacterium]|jgi:aminotransferase|nr:aminotransferase class I/II-fold pyridoxal phosphate-dependent enzyme [Lactobacillaceae bacterium]